MDEGKMPQIGGRDWLNLYNILMAMQVGNVTLLKQPHRGHGVWPLPALAVDNGNKRYVIRIPENERGGLANQVQRPMARTAVVNLLHDIPNDDSDFVMTSTPQPPRRFKNDELDMAC